MLSVRAPDDSPLQLVLWQDQLCKLSTLLACLSQGASKLILEGSTDGLLWFATLANHGENWQDKCRPFCIT